MNPSFNFPFEKYLNEEQLDAVNTINGPVLVIAGAGSGKTRTIVFRLLNLIRVGINPQNILLLTFTRKAAQSMIQRASDLIGDISTKVLGGTFHGFSHLMLRKYHKYAGLKSDFTILDRSDVQDIFNLIIKQKSQDIKKKIISDKKFLSSLSSKMSNYNGNLLFLIDNEYPHLIKDFEILNELMNSYMEYKKNANLLDFDDLLTRWLDTLKNNPTLQEIISDNFKYIMVDEYQDTNTIQAEMVKVICGKEKNIMAVGDDSQSIYGFRGANFKNILDFPRIFPNCKIIKLEKNYRSTQPNLDCTNAIISQAKESFHKRLVAVRDGGTPPFYFYPFNEDEQAKFIVDRIKELLEINTPPNEIAVLFRASFHSFRLETELSKNNIKYEKRGGLKLFEAAHIKDIISLLRLTVNPLDPISLNRVLMFINKIGTKTVISIYEKLIESQDPIEYLLNFETKSVWKDDLKKLANVIKNAREESLSTLEKFKTLHNWYLPILKRLYPEDYPRRNLELQQLYEISEKYSDTSEFLCDITLEPPSDLSGEKNDNKSVILSTIHSAKGLEWKVVFIISLCEGMFPIHTGDPDEIEEERRLFYVASTRAKDLLFFLIPSSSSGLPVMPSRFFREIPKNLMNSWEKQDVVRKSHEMKEEDIMSLSVKNINLNKIGKASFKKNVEIKPVYRIGSHVSHQIFGKGIVTDILSDEKIKVRFPDFGEKTMNVIYANLVVLH